MNNIEIAKVLYDIAEILEVNGVDFKPRAYEKAAKGVEELSENIEDVYRRGELEKIPGVGKHIAGKIEELIKTGKSQYYLDLKKKTPIKVNELMDVEGMSSKRIMLLYKKLGVRNLKDLKRLAKLQRIRKIKSLGPKVEEDILRGIEFLKKKTGRFLFGYIIPVAEEIKLKIESLESVKKVEIAGSYRRRKESVGDIDILVTTNNGKEKEIMDYFVKMNDVERILSKGRTKSVIRLNSGLNVDLRVLKEKEYGSALQYFTGNKDHNVALRKIALRKGYTLSEYGLFKLKGKKWIAGKTEKEIYRRLGLKYIPPEMRENNGEIDRSLRKKLPDLIGYGKAKSNFHTHSDWSDGKNSIGEMVQEAERLKLRCVAITDHVGQIAITNPLNERRLERQSKTIDKLNKKYNIRILKGAEVDILKNGKLALSKKAQGKLDIVLASVHMALKMPVERMTQRIVSAMENNRIHILCHPTGRLLEKREPYFVNLDKVFRVAEYKDIFLEINCHPKRMDLSGEHIKAAKEVGSKFSIGTDAHNVSHLSYLDLGVGLARRGWLEEKDVLNTFSVRKIDKFLESR